MGDAKLELFPCTNAATWFLQMKENNLLGMHSGNHEVTYKVGVSNTLFANGILIASTMEERISFLEQLQAKGHILYVIKRVKERL